MPQHLYRQQRIGEVTLIELTLPDVLDSSEFDQLNESLLAAVDQAPHERWVLDLSGSYYMGSAVLGLLVNLRQRIKAGGGRIVLCGMGRKLLQIFQATSLVRLFTIVKTQPEALSAAH